MKVLHGDVWKRRGVSLLWGGQTLSVLTEPQSVVSIRQFFALQSNWPDELPCNAGKTLVVAGLEGCIDILKPSEAEFSIFRPSMTWRLRSCSGCQRARAGCA